METAEPRLRTAFVAAYGEELGLEATAEAVAYGWEHWKRVGDMQNPAGYLYRVGQSAAVRSFRRPAMLPRPETHELPDFEPALLPALDQLSDAQRVAVVLVHGFGWSQVELAELFDVDSATIRKHLSRGLRKLKDALEVDSHV